MALYGLPGPVTYSELLPLRVEDFEGFFVRRWFGVASSNMSEKQERGVSSKYSTGMPSPSEVSISSDPLLISTKSAILLF
jgi:hypothetical protein